MDSQTAAVYCLCNDLLKALYHPEDPQRRMSNVEVMTSFSGAVVAKTPHAVTPAGFELKVALFVLACSINYLVR